MKSRPKLLSTSETTTLLKTLKMRFANHAQRHPGIAWRHVEVRLLTQPEKLWTLHQMEESGGEPDVVFLEGTDKEPVYCDCIAESPIGRRSLCYDDAALLARKANKPDGSALGLASEMGIEILNEIQYRMLQELHALDQKTSSWVHTPEAIRSLGGAVFCDRRYNHVFLYHNSAESYYGSRGFRGLLRL